MSLGSSIRSAARATFSGPRRLPIRWRLAGGSALLTFVILCGFAGAVGTLTAQRIHSDFDSQVESVANRLQARIDVRYNPASQQIFVATPGLNTFVGGTNAAIKVVDGYGRTLKSSDAAPPWLGPPSLGAVEIGGWRVETREVDVRGLDDQYFGRVWVQYARPLADVQATVNRVRFFLVVGVLSGTGLALLAGLWIATRAMAPIAELTAAAREIERTRDPGRRVADGEPTADDEVAELARTLDDMLGALDASRNETEAALQRQREFVADASHELRTPLTSVLANLELLAETLDGERGEAAASALRSSRRMRRLVADLLLLARADAERQAPRAPTDVAEVLMEAAGELTAVGDGHELRVEADRAIVDGARDELHRLVLNLMENALRHTPAGTRVRAGVHRRNGDVVLTVEDDGPGIPPELRDRVFERFVRGAGDRGGSFGLGLSIVRAVAEAHGGRVDVQSPTTNGGRPAHGTRFVVTLPAAVR